MLKEYLWDIFNVSSEASKETKKTGGNLDAAVSLFISACRGEADFDCLSKVDKDAVVKSWDSLTTEDQQAEKKWYTDLLYYHRPELCAAYSVGDRKKFEAIVNQ